MPSQKARIRSNIGSGVSPTRWQLVEFADQSLPDRSLVPSREI
jgi:hypothetical protein